MLKNLKQCRAIVEVFNSEFIPEAFEHVLFSNLSKFKGFDICMYDIINHIWASLSYPLLLLGKIQSNNSFVSWGLIEGSKTDDKSSQFELHQLIN